MSMQSNSTNPLVSVIIPFFHQEKFLAEAVASVKQQQYASIELIVVDDGSPVPAASILKKDLGIRMFRNENRGVSAARNFGLARSMGEYIIFLDADDRLLPHAVSSHLRLLQSHPEACMVFGARRVIDAQGKELQGPHVCRPRKNYFHMLLESNPIGCPGAAMMRRVAIEKVGGFDEMRRMAEDYHLYLRMARYTPIVRSAACVLEYRDHGGGVSKDTRSMLDATISMLDSFAIEAGLSQEEMSILEFGRKRWRHVYDLNTGSATHQIRDLYYKLRAFIDVPIGSYFETGTPVIKGQLE